MPRRPAKSAHVVGARLRAFREEKGISQETAAAAFRTEQGRSVLATYRRWELTGKITAPDLLVAASVLGVDPCWVLTGQGTPVLVSADDPGLNDRVEGRVAALAGDVQDLEAELAGLEREDPSPPAAEAAP